MTQCYILSHPARSIVTIHKNRNTSTSIVAVAVASGTITAALHWHIPCVTAHHSQNRKYLAKSTQANSAINAKSNTHRTYVRIVAISITITIYIYIPSKCFRCHAQFVSILVVDNENKSHKHTDHIEYRSQQLKTLASIQRSKMPSTR